MVTKGVRNYVKLDLLIGRSYILLRELFKRRYSLFNGGRIWNDTALCGNNYFSNVINRNKNIHLTAVQKTSIAAGDTNEWDLTTLTVLLLNVERPITLKPVQIQQIDAEDRFLLQLREIRNKLAHHASKSVVDVDFEKDWTALVAILMALGDVESELDKVKDDSVFESSSQSINKINVRAATHWNALGTQAHKDRKLSDAIDLFTKATVLPGVANHERAVFFSNMSSSRLALYEQIFTSSSRADINGASDQRYRALQDAKQARILWPTWWKGHFRVGKVYATLNENDKAITSFERALALAPTNDEIKNALVDARQTHSRQLRQEHLDPRLQPITMDEHLNEMKTKFGFDPQHIRFSHSLVESIDPVAADVVKGHKYEHGDVDIKQDYEQAARYFAKAARQGNAEGIYNLARLTDRGLGVKKDYKAAHQLLEEAAAQPPQDPMFPSMPNLGVSAAEHALGLRYADGIGVAKNLATAAYWYQRAVDHDSPQSANNLGLIYQAGNGVDRNLEKAQQLFELSGRGGDPNAMLTLAQLLLYEKGDLEMAKIWYDRACEAGNLTAQAHRAQFEKVWQYKKESLNGLPSDFLQNMRAAKNFISSVTTPKSISKLSGYPYMKNYDLLHKHANRGSVTAQRLCDALDHFAKALKILTGNDSLSDEQENVFVHELSQCYRIEHFVGQFPGTTLRAKSENIINEVLHRCRNGCDTTTVAGLDEDARVCYATFHMGSFQLVASFLDLCKQKYSNSIYFFELGAAANVRLQNYEASLYDSNQGLMIDPNYCELLYFKAVALRLLGTDVKEAISAYRAFLSRAPKDHRKVPESYYAMASCHIQSGYFNAGVIDTVKNIYKQGEEAEKLQLLCFLPYDSTSKKLLARVVDPTALLEADLASPIDNRTRLTDPHRVEIMRKHRQWQLQTTQFRNDPNLCEVFSSHNPRVQQQTAKSLIGLKAISLREMDATIDRVYEGCVLSVKIIEDAHSWHPSIHLVIEDEHLDCERMFIYGFPEGQGEYLTSEVFNLGSRMNIINPYLRLGANDMKSLIRVDDFSSILMQNGSERVKNMCRCCGEANASHMCGKCGQSQYCRKECQVMDWSLYGHKLVCKKQ